MTEIQQKSAAKFLAGKALMEFKDGGTSITGKEYYEFESYDLYKKDWQPYADTPESLWQCLGEGGIVEKMREKGWMLKFNVYQLLYEACFYNPKTKESTWPMTDNFCPGAAITLAAATALGWKEEL